MKIRTLTLVALVGCTAGNKDLLETQELQRALPPGAVLAPGYQVREMTTPGFAPRGTHFDAFSSDLYTIEEIAGGPNVLHRKMMGGMWHVHEEDIGDALTLQPVSTGEIMLGSPNGGVQRLNVGHDAALDDAQAVAIDWGGPGPYPLYGFDEGGIESMDMFALGDIGVVSPRAAPDFDALFGVPPFGGFAFAPPTFHVDLETPVDLAIGDRTYMIDTGDDTVTPAQPQDAFTTGRVLVRNPNQWDLVGAPAMDHPVAIAFDHSSGALVIADAGAGVIWRMGTDGSNAVALLTGLSLPMDHYASLDVGFDGAIVVTTATDVIVIEPSADCDMAFNGAPPEDDCDNNGMLDSCDLDAGAPDCNDNDIVDMCEVGPGAIHPAPDCDGNLIPDACDVQSPAFDCDANGLVDWCETDPANATAVDCNQDRTPDTCQVGDPVYDCDNDGLIDVCDPGDDCNGNAIPDMCDAMADPSLDCDGNLALDACELGEGVGDCDSNGLFDACEVLQGTADCNGDLFHDACAVCSPIDLIVVIDNSLSMSDSAGVCAGLATLRTDLIGAGMDLSMTVRVIGNDGERVYPCSVGSVEDEYSPIVSVVPPITFGNRCDAGNQVTEDWLRAVGVVARNHDAWRPGASRFILPMSDEGPICGGPAEPGPAETAQDVDMIAPVVTALLNAGDITLLGALNEDMVGDWIVNAQSVVLDLGSGASASLTVPAFSDIIEDSCRRILDCDLNGSVDVCELDGATDPDGDGILEVCDSCPGVDNHIDSDGDGIGDGFEDFDGDGRPDLCDPCVADPNHVDGDGDGIPDDTDGDGVPDSCDRCPEVHADVDNDGDGVPDELQDSDFDSIPDACDVCPNVHIITDNNGDGIPDALQDVDGDGVADACDTCLQGPNVDSDGDGFADPCDPCPNEPGDPGRPCLGDGAVSCVGPAGETSDGDFDGICDSIDACPGEFFGCVFPICPDTNSNGVCDEAELPLFCPDFDSDGICDGEEAGCHADADNDGICDSADFHLSVGATYVGQDVFVVVERAAPGSRVIIEVSQQVMPGSRCYNATACLDVSNGEVVLDLIVGPDGRAVGSYSVPADLSPGELLAWQAAWIDGVDGDVTPLIIEPVAP